MKTAKEIQSEGDGIRLLTRKDVGAAFKLVRDYKLDGVSYWRRKRGKASK